jgi:hypothetical protein
MTSKTSYKMQLIGFLAVIVVVLAGFWLFYDHKPIVTVLYPTATPTATPDNSWKTADTQSATFRYPEKLQTAYISTQDWPPQLIVSDGTFKCTEGGSEINRAGITEKKVINNNTYCVTKESEGAAGSTYTMYSYITAKGNNKLANLIFTLRYVQCANYNDLQKTQCETERQSFDIDGLMDRIAQTIQLK